jgi:hypothetical protein
MHGQTSEIFEDKRLAASFAAGAFTQKSNNPPRLYFLRFLQKRGHSPPSEKHYAAYLKNKGQ